MRPKPQDYFLPPHRDADPGLVLPPVRLGRRLSTIVDGEAIFVALEEAVATAKKSVLIAFWSLELVLPLSSPTARKGGRKTWLDLLVAAAKRRVIIRLLITDFDPFLFGGGEPHLNAWLDYRRVATAAAKEKLPNLQVVCARHRAEIAASNVGIFTDIGLRYAAVADELNGMDLKRRAATFANSPGLWEVLDWSVADNTVVVRGKNKVAPVFPATHHQKLVVVDGRVAFTGGINLIRRNRDSRRHHLLDKENRPLPWHDAFLRVEGEPVGDLRDNFIVRWNEERKVCEAFLKTANAALPMGKMPIVATDDLDAKQIPLVAPGKAANFPCQVHRTLARPPNSWRGVPTPKRQDVLDGYLQAIGLAERFIYIENQYFREQAIADAIIARHDKQKNLRTLIVLPDVAEELIGGNPDRITNHGAFLQHRAIDQMMTKIGSAVGFFCMKRPKDAKPVYVHTKVLIVDDVYGNLGSANANPRSFRMDTELNLAWHDPVTVRRFRTDLWKEQLGSPSGMPGWRPKEYVKQWSKLATSNARASAKGHAGYVFPFDNRARGAQNILVPEEFT